MMNKYRYTKEMVAAVKSVKPPYSGLAIDLVEFPDYLAIRIYENQIMALPEGHKVSVLEYLHQLRGIVMSFGIEKVYFDGAKGDPPRGGLR
jgi:hypothetical protein